MDKIRKLKLACLVFLLLHIIFGLVQLKDTFELWKIAFNGIEVSGEGNVGGSFLDGMALVLKDLSTVFILSVMTIFLYIFDNEFCDEDEEDDEEDDEESETDDGSTSVD